MGDVDVTGETAGPDDLTENPISLLVSVPPFSDSRTLGLESVVPATVVELTKFPAIESDAPNFTGLNPSPGDDELNGTCGTFSKPNMGADLVRLSAGAPVAVDETTLLAKLNMAGLATDPFGEAGFSEPKLIFVASVIPTVTGLFAPGIDGVIDVDISTFSPTLVAAAPT